MGSDIRLTPKARADLEDIFLYTAREWSPEQARTYVRLLSEAMERVAAEPDRAKRIDDICEGYAQYRAGSHLLVFRPTEAGIEIVRILHMRMDITRHV